MSSQNRTTCDCGAPAKIVKSGTRVCHRCAELDAMRHLDPKKDEKARYGMEFFRVLIPSR